MIINHHFRVEIKAHNFNLSSVNKRFLPPVISISPVTFFISNRLRSLSADSRNARPSRVKPLYHLKLLCAFTTVKTSLQRRGKIFFPHQRSHPSSSSEAVRDYSPPSRQTNHHVVSLECAKKFFQGPVCWDPSWKSP